MSKPNQRNRHAANGRSIPKREASRNSKTASASQTRPQALLASLRALRKERDAYQRAVYAWIEEQLAKDDGQRLAVTKDGLPLSHFIDQLEKEVHGR